MFSPLQVYFAGIRPPSANAGLDTVIVSSPSSPGPGATDVQTGCARPKASTAEKKARHTHLNTPGHFIIHTGFATTEVCL